VKDSTQASRNAIMTQVRAFVLERAQSIGLTKVSDEDELFESGIIHSLALFRLVAQLEEHFGVGISDDEINPRNFRTIITISHLIETKLVRLQPWDGVSVRA